MEKDFLLKKKFPDKNSVRFPSVFQVEKKNKFSIKKNEFPVEKLTEISVSVP